MVDFLVIKIIIFDMSEYCLVGILYLTQVGEIKTKTQREIIFKFAMGWL